MKRLVNAEVRILVEPVFTLGAWYFEATIHVKPQDFEIAGMITPEAKVEKRLFGRTGEAWSWIEEEMSLLMY